MSAVFYSFQWPILQDLLRNIDSTIPVDLRAILQEILEPLAFDDCHITYSKSARNTSHQIQVDGPSRLTPPSNLSQTTFKPSTRVPQTLGSSPPTPDQFYAWRSNILSPHEAWGPQRDWAHYVTKQSSLPAHQQTSMLKSEMQMKSLDLSKVDSMPLYTLYMESLEWRVTSDEWRVSNRVWVCVHKSTRWLSLGDFIPDLSSNNLQLRLVTHSRHS
jgi:hypothetical protein